MTETDSQRSVGSISTSRIEAFSDGVFAIATTLLVLEIAAPERHGDNDLGADLFALWPSYVAYLVSFLTIGVMWVNHHFLLGLYERIDRTLLLLNLGLLAVVAFIPFPTAVIAEYLVDGTPGQLTAAAMLYGAVMLVLTVMFLLLWRHAARGPQLLKNADASAPPIRRATVFCGIAGAVYILAIALSAVVPIAALVLFAAVAALFAFGRLANR